MADGKVVLPENTTVIVSGENEGVGRNFAFDAITFKDAGTYIFTITEDTADTEDGVKDSVVYAAEPVTVTYVIGKTDGVLNVTSTEYTPEDKTLVNTYVYTTFAPKVRKSFLNGAISENQFGFILTEVADETATTGEPARTVRVSDTQATGFDEITYTLSQLTETDEQGRKTKTFHYIITEDIPETANSENDYIVEGIRYDSTIHRLDVTVTDSGDSTLQKQILLDGSAVGETEATAEFLNERPMTLDIVKVDREHTEELLDGAKFELDRYTVPDTPDGSYTWKKSGETVTTDEDGQARFENLTHGYYRIREIKAPNGYMYTGSGAFHVRIDEDGMTLLAKGEGTDPSQWPAASGGKTGDVLAFETGVNSLTKTATVGNKIGTVLPSTGGTGNGMYTAAGLTMILTAGILMIIRRRRDRTHRE